ncbi:hypothetical protein [Neisseria sp.]|uniref:hypothetical protein n=1 Tax=Neisseria sp. TaxID=192066 RepID=UPI0026DB42C9|nr:hypothetical protein [Neisseria sp.]
MAAVLLRETVMIRPWLKPAWIGVWFAAVYFFGNGIVFYLSDNRLAAPFSYITAWPFSMVSSAYIDSYGRFLLMNAVCWYGVGHCLYNFCRIFHQGVPSVAVRFMFGYTVILAMVFGWW